MCWVNQPGASGAAWRPSGPAGPAPRPTPAQPLTMARISGAELLRGLAAETGRLTALAEQIQQAIAVVGDPTAAEVELEATRTAAEQRATTAAAAAAAAA